MKRVGRLEITTKIGCNINCIYCPQKLLLSQYFKDNPNRKSLLTLEDFKICIDKLPEKTRIDFSGMAEPWLNRSCTDMVCYAAEKGHPIAIYTTLVGMSKQDFDRIKDFDFEEFVLHIPDDQSNAHIMIEDEYVQLLHEVIAYKRQGNSIVTGYSCHGGIHPEILDAISKDSKLITELIDRAGNLQNDYVDSKINDGEIVCVNCEDDINHNVLLPDGTVLLCCMDYGMKHVLGNLLKESYDTIQNSLESKKVRQGLSGLRNDILCKTCTNGRSIHELYDEFEFYRDWCKKMSRNEVDKDRDLANYKEWVENLQKQQKNQKIEYTEWIQKLELKSLDDDKQIEDYEDEIKNMVWQRDREKEVYIETVKELESYKLQVEELEKWQEEVRAWKGYNLLMRLNCKK